MPLRLFCRHCRTGYACVGKVPTICPSCERSASWTTTALPGDEPEQLYVLSENDRRLLRSLRIGAD